MLSDIMVSDLINLVKGDVFAFEKQKEEPTSDGLLTFSGRGDTVVSSSKQRIPQGNGEVKKKYSREMDTQKALERQNALLREKLEYWKEQTRTRKNIGKKADQAEVRKLARKLLREYSSETSLEEILPELQSLANQNDLNWSKDPNKGYKKMLEAAEELARKILEGSGVDVNGELAEDRKALKQYLRATPINVTDSIKSGMTAAVLLLTLVDMLMNINLIGWVDAEASSILASAGIVKLGITELFAFLFTLYEATSILKNMLLCGLPIPAGLREKVAKWLEKMTDETNVPLRGDGKTENEVREMISEDR